MFLLKPGRLTLKDIDYLLQHPIGLKLAATSMSHIEQSYQQVKSLCQGEQTVYGINTGFGLLAKHQIDKNDLKALQNRLVLSHAVGVGEHFPPDTVKLIMLLKINSLARGFSGVSPQLLGHLIKLYNAQIYPVIPSQGSVGASGDLAPLAYLALCLIGLGQVHYKGRIYDASYALKQEGIEVLELQEKEGLSLLNGTQVSTALGLMALMNMQRNFILASLAGALSLDAAAGKIEPFHAKIAELKNSEAQQKYCELMRALLQDSEILLNPTLERRVQDPYCLRCQPQVMGAVLSTLWDSQKHLIEEANAVSDNPLLVPDLNLVLSGGNFHAEIAAFQSDFLAICGAEIGAISERRIAFLMDSHISGLPAFLVMEGGLNSGFMLAHVTSAALASENKTYAHPASVDSLPTSGNQEDHVSMAPFAGMKALKVAENVLHILAIELMAACQALDFRLPLKTSKPLESIYQKIRLKVSFYEEDRFLGQDVSLITQLIRQRDFYEQHYQDFFLL